MKKTLIALFAFFISMSIATAAPTTPTNPTLAAEIQASLVKGATIDQVIAQYSGSNSIYSTTEVLGTLAEIVAPIHFNNILAAAQALTPTFVPILQSIIDDRIAIYTAAGGIMPAAPIIALTDPTATFDPTAAGGALDPFAIDPTAALAPTAAGTPFDIPISPINIAFNNPVSGVIQSVSP